MVAGGRRGDTALQLFGSELREQVDAAPHLECAEPLVIFVLDVNMARAEQLFQTDVPMKGRPGDIARDAPLRLEDIVQGGWLSTRDSSILLLIPTGELLLAELFEMKR